MKTKILEKIITSPVIGQETPESSPITTSIESAAFSSLRSDPPRRLSGEPPKRARLQSPDAETTNKRSKHAVDGSSVTDILLGLQRTSLPERLATNQIKQYPSPSPEDAVTMAKKHSNPSKSLPIQFDIVAARYPRLRRIRWALTGPLSHKSVRDVFMDVGNIIGKEDVEQIIFALDTCQVQVQHTVVKGDETRYADMCRDFAKTVFRDHRANPDYPITIEIEPDPQGTPLKAEQKEEEEDDGWDFQI